MLVPTGVTYTGKTDSTITTSTVTDSIDFPGQKKVTFQFKGGILPAGSAGQLVVKGKFENYVTPDGTSAATKAEFTATDNNGDLVSMESNVATVTSQGSAPWSIEIKKIAPIVEPFKGSDVQYEISLKPNIGNGNGLLDITNIVVTASLDNGAVFVSADNGGTLGPDNTVVWNLSDNLRNEKKLKLVVNYPASMTAIEAALRAEMQATPLGGTPATISSSVTHVFAASPIDAGTSFNFYTNEQERSPGQTVSLYLSGLSNKANVSVDSGVLEIMTPTLTESGTPLGLQLQTIKSALFSGILEYDLYYTLDPSSGVWEYWGKPNANTATTYDATAIGNIKGIQVRFGTLPIDWSQLSNFEFTYLLDPTTPVPLNSSDSIRSSANFRYVFDGVPKSSSDDSVTSIVNNRPLLELQNTVSKTSAAPAETVTYTLSVTNHALLSSDALDNPVIHTILPADLEYVPESWSIVKPAGTPADPTFTAVPQPSGETKLTWSWDDSNRGKLFIGENVQIQFKAKIKPGTAAQIVTNTFGVASPNYLNDVNYRNQKTAGTTTYSVEATSSINVEESTALQSRMWVKGELDASWLETTGSTTPGGQALYRLEIQNIGNVAMKELAIVNPFPRIGDTAVLNGSIPRGSQWGPVLMGAVNVPNYVTVQYSTTSGITMNPTTAADNGIWTASLPTDPTSVTAIKLIFDSSYVINPLSTTTLEWAMRAPVGAPTGGETAWNSFAYQVKNASGQSLLPAEPNKVGMKILSSPKASIGNFVWLDSNENGTFDDGTETGLDGVTVELYDANDTKLAATVTSNDFQNRPGAYLFPNLEPGNYRVVFKPDSSYEAVNSDLITLGAGENYLVLDAGIVPKKGKIGNLVWIDANENGLQDASESGLNGVTVHLYNGSGTLLATTTSATYNGQAGHYVFDNLNPGNYQVEFVLPSVEYGFTGETAGADQTIDSDANPATGKTSVFSLALGEKNLTVDAGITQLPRSGTQTATASAATLTPVAGADNTITLTVKDALGNTDMNFDGNYNVTISGTEQAPKGSYGSFGGTVLKGGTQTISVSFTDGGAMPVLVLHKADEQTIGFSIADVATPATNTQAITPSVGSLSAMALTQDITAPAANGGQFAQQPTVTLVDAFGNIRIGDNSTEVTVLKKDTGAWTLTGTATATASAGIVTFTGLGATNTAAVTGAQLAFDATGLTQIASQTVTLPGPGVTAPIVESATAGDSRVRLTWSEMPGSVTYAVYQGTASGTYGDAIATVTGTVYDAVGLMNGITYYYVVKAINPSGISAASNEVSATPQVSTPGAPILDRATPGNRQIRLSWSPVIGSTGYKVFKSTTSGAYGLEEASVSDSVYGYDVTGLTNGTLYYFVVKATNPGGDSVASNEVSATSRAVSGRGSAPEQTPVPPQQTPIPTEQTPVSPQPKVGVFISSIVNEANLVNTIESKVAEAKEANATIDFADTQGHWAEKTIDIFVKLQLIDGYEDGTFRLDSPITRAEFAVILNRAFNIQGGSNTSIVLKDIGDNWAKGAIENLVAAGVIKGYDDSTFKPDKTITREEMVVMLSR
ncbi:hypothetical protein CF651_24565, partial [Paenibacillus rigui]